MINFFRTILVMFFFFFNTEEDKFSREEGKVIKLITKNLSKKGFQSSGWGESVTDLKLNELILLFKIDKEVSIDISRKMVYEIAQTVLSIINDYKPIQEYLGCYPFTYKNLSIALLPEESKNLYVYSVTRSNNKINFTVNESNMQRRTKIS